MDLGLVIALALALAFAATNGLHDASNAIATLVATRAATPLQAIIMASFFNMLGPLLLGAAVADTIAGIVTVSPDEAVAVIGSGLAAAVIWNLLTWKRGLPSSSSHALVGGLVGAAIVEADILNHHAFVDVAGVVARTDVVVGGALAAQVVGRLDASDVVRVHGRVSLHALNPATLVSGALCVRGCAVVGYEERSSISSSLTGTSTTSSSSDAMGTISMNPGCVA